MTRYAILITNSHFPLAGGALGTLKTVHDDFEAMKQVLRKLRGSFDITPLPDMALPEIQRNLDRTLREVKSTNMAALKVPNYSLSPLRT